MQTPEHIISAMAAAILEKSGQTAQQQAEAAFDALLRAGRPLYWLDDDPEIGFLDLEDLHDHLWEPEYPVRVRLGLEYGVVDVDRP